MDLKETQWKGIERKGFTWFKIGTICGPLRNTKINVWVVHNGGNSLTS